MGISATSPLFALCALACPLSMAAMMWFMVRGSRSTPPAKAEPPSTVADLRREHERLGVQIANLDGEHAGETHAATARPLAGAGARDTRVR
jgi:hypothetical protein